LPDPNRTEAAEAARVAQQPPFDAEALVAVLVDNRSWTALAKIGSIYSSHKANGSSTAVSVDDMVGESHDPGTR